MVDHLNNVRTLCLKFTQIFVHQNLEWPTPSVFTWLSSLSLRALAMFGLARCLLFGILLSPLFTIFLNGHAIGSFLPCCVGCPSWMSGRFCSPFLVPCLGVFFFSLGVAFVLAASALWPIWRLLAFSVSTRSKWLELWNEKAYNVVGKAVLSIFEKFKSLHFFLKKAKNRIFKFNLHKSQHFLSKIAKKHSNFLFQLAYQSPRAVGFW